MSGRPLLAPSRIIRRPTKLFVALGVVVGALASRPVRAESSQSYPPCNKTVTASDTNIAHEKYIAGSQDLDESNYDSAIRRFRDAYMYDCTKHELLIKIAAVYERKGDKKEAIAALETYVSRSPSAPDIGTYQTRIENLKRQMASTAPPSTTPPSTTPSSTTPSPSTAPPSTTAPPSAEPREHSVIPWIVTGVGGAAILVGVVVLVTTPELPIGCVEKTEQCNPVQGEVLPTPGDPNPTPKQLADKAAVEKRGEEAGRIFAQPKVGLALTIGGAALAAGGLVWHFLEPVPRKEAGRPKLLPAIAPGYAGLGLTGSF